MDQQLFTDNQLLEQKEEEELRLALLESRVLHHKRSAQLKLLHKSNQETLDLALQFSQQQQHFTTPIKHRETFELELALALSLEQVNKQDQNINSSDLTLLPSSEAFLPSSQPAVLPSPQLALLPTSSNYNQFTPSSTCSNYVSTSSASPPLLGKPLPQVPDRSKKPSSLQCLNYDQDRSKSSSLLVFTQPPSFSLSTTALNGSGELTSHGLVSSQPINPPYKPCSIKSPTSPHSKPNLPLTSKKDSVTYTIIPADESSLTPITDDPQDKEVNRQQRPTIDLTITTYSSPGPSKSPSLTTTTKQAESSTSIISPSSEPFGANPTPPENVTEGIQFGSIKAINETLVSVGQFPNVVELSQFLKGFTTKVKNPLFAIEAWSWNRLLTYLMWHGNSRIEPGPLDITEAEDEGLGVWHVGVSVIFKEGEGRASARLVLELVAGNGESQWNRNIPSEGRRHSSVIIGSSSHSKRDSVRYQDAEVIHLPSPFLTLPIQLSTLACNLHEIHSVSRMHSSIHTGITCSFKSNKHKNKNIGVYSQLSKAIENNSKILKEEEEDDENYQDKDKLIVRGKNWFKKKKFSLSSSNTSSNSTSNLQLLLLQSKQNSNLERNKKFTKVDGLGLPLPDGATMVRPWDSDWC